MKHQIKIAIDYDKTLTRKDVYEYVEALIKLNIDIWIVTFRYDDDNFHKYKGRYGDTGNDDLWSDARNLGIEDKVIFTNHTSKADVLNEEGGFLLILDDDQSVMSDVTNNSKVIPIQVNTVMYQRKINKLINNNIIKQYANTRNF